ncbi:MAG: acetate kinase [Clostridiales bacterium]|jgi:acetate kinase|nr:acetate kinase [Clostridiales bacterium]MBF0988356.1 acetate kinase [Clostridiales bacterium]
MNILILNSGSSSLKYQLINTQTDMILAKGNFERIGQQDSFLTHKLGSEKHKFELPAPNHEMALNIILGKLTSRTYGVISGIDKIDAIGHRIVHGGDKFVSSCLITEEVIKEIEDCIPLAPLHNPAAVAGIRACQDILVGKPNVAAFDTAFHQTMKPEQYLYPIPYKYYEKYKIRKYGFHGISHDYVSSRVASLKGTTRDKLRIVNCHLGQGASICAIKNGESVDTSMGFTPVAGFCMGTRSGDLDPSIVTFLNKKENISPDEIERILNYESGIFGVSGASVDFRDVENEALLGDHRSQLAMNIFLTQVAQTIASYIVTMGGIDVLTFTAGVGEKGFEDREEICKKLAFLGLKLDIEKNKSKNIEDRISLEDSKIDVWVVPTNEELMIARDTEKIVNESKTI